jgi:hypothetical protein
MAAVTVTFDGTRLSSAETENDGGTWDDWGKATSPTQETDFVYQGTYAMSNKISGGTGGVEFEDDATINYESPKKAVLAKVNVTTYALINGAVEEGMSYQVGSDPSAYYNYYIYGSEASYPFTGGWQLLVIDPTVTGYRDAQVGRPDLALVDYYGLYADITGSAKADNVVHDALDYIIVGSGLSMRGGDGGDTDGVFQDFADYDEGTSSNRYGVCTTKEGIYYVLSTLTIGTETSATEFTDSNQALVFPDGRFDAGFCGISVDLQHPSTQVSVSDCVFKGRGSKFYYDTRPDFTFSGVDGAGAYNDCTFDTFRKVTMTSAATVDGCKFLGGEEIIQASGLIQNCSVSQATTTSGFSFILSNDPGRIISNDFTFSDGHAIELTVSGTYTLDGNTFTGYGVDGSNNAAIFNNSSAHVTLDVVNAASPTVRNGVGATTVVNNNVILTITVEDADGDPIQNAQTAIYRSSDGVELMNEDTDEDGEATATYNYGASPVPIYIRVRKSSPGTARYVRFGATGTIQATGFSLTVTLQEDPNV